MKHLQVEVCLILCFTIFISIFRMFNYLELWLILSKWTVSISKIYIGSAIGYDGNNWGLVSKQMWQYYTYKSPSDLKLTCKAVIFASNIFRFACSYLNLADSLPNHCCLLVDKSYCPFHIVVKIQNWIGWCYSSKNSLTIITPSVILVSRCLFTKCNLIGWLDSLESQDTACKHLLNLLRGRWE